MKTSRLLSRVLVVASNLRSHTFLLPVSTFLPGIDACRHIRFYTGKRIATSGLELRHVNFTLSSVRRPTEHFARLPHPLQVLIAVMTSAFAPNRRRKRTVPKRKTMQFLFAGTICSVHMYNVLPMPSCSNIRNL